MHAPDTRYNVIMSKRRQPNGPSIRRIAPPPELTDDNLIALAGKDFRPTDAMLAYARVYVAAKPGTSVNRMCQEAGVSASTCSKWRRRNPHFMDWIRRVCDWRSSLQVPMIWEVVRRKALEGTVAACRMFLDRFDPDWKAQAKGMSTVRAAEQVMLEVDVPEDLEPQDVGTIEGGPAWGGGG